MLGLILLLSSIAYQAWYLPKLDEALNKALPHQANLEATLSKIRILRPKGRKAFAQVWFEQSYFQRPWHPKAEGGSVVLYTSYQQAQALQIGARYAIRATLKHPSRARNLYTFNPAPFYQAKGVVALGALKHIRLIQNPGVSSARLRVFNALKASFTAVLSPLNQETQGVMLAMLLGDGSLISSKGWQLFRQSGILHLMVVSGMHISLFYFTAFWVFLAIARVLLMGLSRWSLSLYRWHHTHSLLPYAALWSLVPTFAYTYLIGFEGSSARAALMSLPMALVIAHLKGSSKLGALGFSFGVLWLWDLFSPGWMVMNVGLWLSYLAVLAIYITLQSSPTLNQAPSWLDRFAIGRFLTLMTRFQWQIFLWITPVTAYLFHQISWHGSWINLLMIPWIETLTLPLLFIVSTGWLIGLPGAKMGLYLIGHYLIEPSLDLLNWFDQHLQLGSPFYISSTGLLLSLLGAGLMVSFRPFRWWLPLWFLPLWFSPPASKIPPEGTFKLVFFDSGNQSLVLIQTHQHAYLFGTGQKVASSHPQSAPLIKLVMPYLAAEKLKLSKVIVPSEHPKDQGGIASLPLLQEHLTAHYQLLRYHKPKRLGRYLPSGCPKANLKAVDGVRLSLQSLGNTCALLLKDSFGTSALLTGELRKLVYADYKAFNYKKLDLLLIPGHAFKSAYQPGMLKHLQAHKGILTSRPYDRFAGNPKVLKAYAKHIDDIERSASHGMIIWRSDEPLKSFFFLP